MSEFKKIHLLAFLLGLAICSLQIAGPGYFLKFSSKSSTEDNQQNPNSLSLRNSLLVKGLHPSHEMYVDKSGDPSDSGSLGTAKHKISSENEKTDLASQSQELHSSRSLVSRDEWDQVKNQKPEIILYFMDRYPREIAEEIINAFR
jgi:hypothetical protein